MATPSVPQAADQRSVFDQARSAQQNYYRPASITRSESETSDAFLGSTSDYTTGVFLSPSKKNHASFSSVPSSPPSSTPGSRLTSPLATSPTLPSAPGFHAANMRKQQDQHLSQSTALLAKSQPESTYRSLPTPSSMSPPPSSTSDMHSPLGLLELSNDFTRPSAFGQQAPGAFSTRRNVGGPGAIVRPAAAIGKGAVATPNGVANGISESHGGLGAIGRGKDHPYTYATSDQYAPQRPSYFQSLPQQAQDPAPHQQQQQQPTPQIGSEASHLSPFAKIPPSVPATRDMLASKAPAAGPIGPPPIGGGSMVNRSKVSTVFQAPQVQQQQQQQQQIPSQDGTAMSSVYNKQSYAPAPIGQPRAQLSHGMNMMQDTYQGANSHAPQNPHLLSPNSSTHLKKTAPVEDGHALARSFSQPTLHPPMQEMQSAFAKTSLDEALSTQPFQQTPQYQNLKTASAIQKPPMADAQGNIQYPPPNGVQEGQQHHNVHSNNGATYEPKRLEALFPAKKALLKNLMLAVKDLVLETNIYCSADGISFQAMDASHKCLVTWYLDGRNVMAPTSSTATCATSSTTADTSSFPSSTAQSSTSSAEAQKGKDQNKEAKREDSNNDNNKNSNDTIGKPDGENTPAAPSSRSVHSATNTTSSTIGPFQRYKCEREMKVGINTHDLFEYLKLINDDDDITLRATEGSAVYELYFESADHTRKGLIEIDAVAHLDDKVAMPEPAYDVVVRLGSKEFERITTSLASCSNHVSISVTKNTITFLSVGAKVTCQIGFSQKPSAADPATAFKVLAHRANVQQTFDTSFLARFAAAVPLSPTIFLYFADRMPVRVAFELGDIGAIHYYLAPSSAPHHLHH